MRNIKNLFSFVTVLFILLFLVTTPVGAAAPIGNYLVLNGGYIKTVNNNLVAPSGFSFEAWIYPDSVAGIQKIISIGSTTKSNPNFEAAINGGSFQFIMSTGITGNGLVSITTGSLEAGKWSHVAVTTNGETPKLYINGVSQYNGPSLAVIYTLTPLGPSIILGNSYNEPYFGGGNFKGFIDEVRISNIARDISSLWSSGTYNSPLITDNNTIYLWHLDGTRGSGIADDASANNLDGILTGGDNLIHFFGVLPTPTSWSMGMTLPTLAMPRWSFPTLSIPNVNPNPQPTTNNLQPTTSFSDVRNWVRPTRSVGR